jgi:predicted amidohydrolase YtcJ
VEPLLLLRLQGKKSLSNQKALMLSGICNAAQNIGQFAIIKRKNS